MKTFIRMLKDQSGASAAEYALILAIVGGNRSPRQLGAVERLHDRLSEHNGFVAATIAGTAIRRRGGELRFVREPGRQAIPETTLGAGLGDREAAVTREVTKKFEEAVTGRLSTLAARYADAPPKGEIVVVVAPPGEAPPADAAEAETALAEALTRLPASKAAGEVAKRFGLDRKALYARALEMKR